MAVKKTTRTKKAPVRKASPQSSPVAHVQAIASKPLATNNVLILLLVAASLLAGYFFSQVQQLKKGQTGNGQPTDQAAVQPEPDINAPKPDPKEHWRGNTNARYVLIEYSDLECPFCKQFHPTAKKFLEENAAEVAWVYRHFPLSQLHPKAQKSAEATECAAEQGGNDAFWNMADSVIEKLPDLELSKLPEVAIEIGLNGDQLQTCLDSDKYSKIIKDGIDTATKANVTATPNLVIYDMKTDKSKTIRGGVAYESLKQTFDDFKKETQ